MTDKWAELERAGVEVVDEGKEDRGRRSPA